MNAGIATNQWNHVAITRSANNTGSGWVRYNLYINGRYAVSCGADRNEHFGAYYEITASGGILVDEFREDQGATMWYYDQSTFPVPTTPYV
jgi:hypothetical protein